MQLHQVHLVLLQLLIMLINLGMELQLDWQLLLIIHTNQVMQLRPGAQTPQG
jgi:hypothetical protein